MRSRGVKQIDHTWLQPSCFLSPDSKPFISTASRILAPGSRTVTVIYDRLMKKWWLEHPATEDSDTEIQSKHLPPASKTACDVRLISSESLDHSLGSAFPSLFFTACLEVSQSWWWLFCASHLYRHIWVVIEFPACIITPPSTHPRLLRDLAFAWSHWTLVLVLTLGLDSILLLFCFKFQNISLLFTGTDHLSTPRNMNPSILASAVVSGRNLNSERWMIFLSLAYVFLLANVTYAKPVPNPTHASNTPRSARAIRGKCINNAPNSDVHSAVTHLTLEVAAMDEYVKVLAHNSVEISSAIKAIYQAMCSEENQNSDRAFLARMQSKGTLGESEKINHEILGYINQITWAFFLIKFRMWSF